MLRGERLLREGHGRAREHLLHQIAVILAADLLGDEQPARLEQPVQLGGAEIAVTVEDEVKGRIAKGHAGRIAAGAKVDAQRAQRPLAQRDVGRISLRGRCHRMGMMQ